MSGQRPGVAFRLAADADGPIHTTGELEDRLRRRLRVIAALMASGMGSLAVIGVTQHWAEISAQPTTLWTEPPMPGVTAILAVISLVMTALLSPRGHLALGQLRLLEWVGVAMTGAFFSVNQTLAMQTFLPTLLGKPMEVGVAQGAPWGILIVTYGVLIPASGRHAALRTGVITLLALLPDALLAQALAEAYRPTAYLMMKVLILGIMSALAIHGSNRIDTLNQEAVVAKQLGQYLLRRSLGEGGMGSVFLAEHRFLRRPCAVKLIRAEQASNEIALARFEREVQSAAALTHPNSVQIYDYGRSEDGTFYFAMEFLPGVPLDKMVDDHGPLPPARAVHVLAQICGALGEAHHRGFVHRDLKPGNVMLCERGGVHDVAKLLDFGLVAAVTSADDHPARITKTGMVVGTPAFMSPEQCMGVEMVTPASDIYSLGALGFFLLTGQPPFGERSPMQALMAHVNETPRFASDVNPEVPLALSQVIARCLAKKPEDRFATVEAVQEALLRSVERQLWTPANARSWWLATQGEPASA